MFFSYNIIEPKQLGIAHKEQPMTDVEFRAKFNEIKSNAAAKIASVIRHKYTPFLHDVSKESLDQRAYNASNGLSFDGINSLLFDGLS